jgi:hypothetical protein
MKAVETNGLTAPHTVPATHDGREHVLLISVPSNSYFDADRVD